MEEKMNYGIWMHFYRTAYTDLQITGYIQYIFEKNLFSEGFFSEKGYKKFVSYECILPISARPSATYKTFVQIERIESENPKFFLARFFDSRRLHLRQNKFFFFLSFLQL